MAGFFLEGFLRLHFSNAWSDIKAFKDGRNIALHFQLGFEGKEQWLTFFIIIEVHIWQFRKGLRQGKFVKRRTNLWLDFFLKVSNAYKIMWSGEADTELTFVTFTYNGSGQVYETSAQSMELSGTWKLTIGAQLWLSVHEIKYQTRGPPKCVHQKKWLTRRPPKNVHQKKWQTQRPRNKENPTKFGGSTKKCPPNPGIPFFSQNFCGHCYSFLAEMGWIPCCGRPESSSSIIW